MRAISIIVIGLFLVPTSIQSAAVVRSASGPDAASITPARDQFRVDIGGGTSVGSNGSFGGLRREINWDFVPDASASPNNFPGNFFNTGSSRHGVEMSTSGTFQVSATAAVGNVEFNNINATYSSIFQVFSAQRLFTSVGSNTFNVTFFDPGYIQVRGNTTAFGAIFTDVDNAMTTSLQFFSAAGQSLGTFYAPVANNGLSFLGVSFDAGERASLVIITLGNAALGPDDAPPTTDVVVMDDFIYGEPKPPVRADMNLDGKPDIIWRNSTTGQNAVWLMNGTTRLSTVDLPALPTNYRIEGTADFNNDAANDLVLRNYVTGQNALWVMLGTTYSATFDLPALPNTDFHIEGTGDWTGNGKPDILWRNYMTGQNAIWQMINTTFSGTLDLPALSNTNYRIESAGDFATNVYPDIVWRNYATGQNALWTMSGIQVTGVVDLAALPNTQYRIEAVGDFTLDGKPDLVWRNYSTGQNALWAMDGTTLSTIIDLPALPNVNYEINGPR